MHNDNNLLYRSPITNIGPVRAKKKSSKRYFLLLVTTKLTLTLSVFLCYDTLQSFNAVIYLFLAKLLTSTILILVHKPISSGKQLTILDCKNVFIYSFFSVVLSLVWLEALIICGPVRTILLSYQSDMIFIVLFNLVCDTGENIVPSSLRGSLFYLIGLLCLFFFDQDKQGKYQQGKENSLSTGIFYNFDKVFTWLGLPDDKGGLLLLLLISFIQLALKNYAKKLSLEIGGNKRLKALSSFMETSVLLPAVVLVTAFANHSLNILSMLPAVIFISIIIYVIDFYVDSVSIDNLHRHLTHRWGSIASFVTAIVIGLIWQHKDENEDEVSMGVIFAAFLFVSATSLLVQVPPLNPPSGKLIGYATDGKPIYTYTTRDGVIPKSVFKKCQQYMRVILESTDSRNIFFYLCINLIFTGVELLYGMWTNSLGLISDGFHMLFDCSALVLGLWASLASKWSANKTFSFGYGRIEVLSGFVNGLFLVVIAFAVFTTAIRRIYDPPMVSTEKLLVVSVAGLVVNILGITVFSHAHSHGGDACEHVSSSHGHSHENYSLHSPTHSHSHGGGHAHEKKQGSSNMQGVFLHVLADTFGSVGVILSTLLIQYFGWLIADPICSLFISILIVLSVIPLLKESASILLQRTPQDLENSIIDSLYKIKDIQGILSYRGFHIWRHTSAEKIGSIIVQIKNDISEQRIRQQVMSLFKECGISKLNVQVEKETYHDHMTKLTTGYYSTVKFPESSTSYSLSANDIPVRIKEI